MLDEVKEFLMKIDCDNESQSYKYIWLLREVGHNLRMPYSKNILPGIFELRVGGVHNIRIVYTFHDGSAVVFYAFEKKTEQITLREINVIKMKYRDLCI